MKKTALVLLVATVTSSTAIATNNDYIFQYNSTKGLFKPLDLTAQFKESDALKRDSGSLTFHLKNGASFGSFFGAADPNANNKYLAFYSSTNNQKTEDIFGIEIKNTNNLIANDNLKVSLPRANNNYRTISYIFDKTNNQIHIYADGQKVKTSNESKFLVDIPSLANAFLGETRRSTAGNYSTWRFAGDIFYADFENKVLTEQEISEKHQSLSALERYSFAKKSPLGAIKTDAENIFSPGQENARNYRIPSLLTTQNGVVIAAIDKRNQHSADWGNIDTVIRRSLDGGKTWEKDQVILDLASQPYGAENAAFLIDPVMVQDRNSGRIFMMLDMFPEMKGFFGLGNHTEGTGYKTIAGKHYRLLTDEQNNQYTVRENGIVYGENNKPTSYRVIIEGDPSKAYKNLGDLYEGDVRRGNIFLNTNQQGTDKAPLTAKRTSYLWITHSDDDGQTWSQPVDITPQVKSDWMQFLGTGPGTGIQLENGNLVLPVYYTNNIGGGASQSAAVIISRDGGQTWERGESPMDRWAYANDGTRELKNGLETTESQLIELDNGDLKMFSRNKLSTKVVISTSKDGGYTWQNSYHADDILAEPYSQLSVIKYSKKINGREVVIFANPHSEPASSSGRASRVNGKVWLGFVKEDGTIDWQYNSSITTGEYAYNSLAELPNGDIGLLYEGESGHIKYVSLNLQELVWHDNLIYRDRRDTDKDRQKVSLDSLFSETFYKIGDGEMVKLGKGANPAHLVIEEGSTLLNQTADSENKKQAYETVLVKENTTLRLGTSDQMPLDKIYLNNGTLDLNGNDISVSMENQLKTAVSDQNINEILGNIVNENNSASATLTYTLTGNKSITGNLGNTLGDLNLTYQPNAENSNLLVKGNTVLNVVDVKSGTLSYEVNTRHVAQKLNIADNAIFAIGDNNTANIVQTKLSGKNSAVNFVTSENNVTEFSTNSSGEGNFNKSGNGLLKLNGNIAHHGLTTLSGGSLEFNGTLNNGRLVLEKGTTFGGNANINGDSLWKQGSLIAPGFNQDTQNFGAQVMQFANVINEGARVLLRVNNTVENISNWQYDQLIVNGQVQSETPIPVDVQMIGNHQGNSDKNQNGKYDVDEGISLIKVAAESNKLQQFVLNSHNTRARSGNSLFQYALVSVDESIAQRTDPNKKFFDYRLQTRLVDEQGNSPEPVIRSIKKTGSSIATQDKPELSELEIANLVLEQKQQELAEKTAELERAKAEKQAAEQDSQRSTAEKVAAEQKAQQAAAEKAIAEQQAQQAAAEKALAEEALRTQQAEKAAEIAKKQQEMANSARQYRAALHHKVPSYLVANTAMLNQGESVHRQFMDNIWSGDKKGFYVNQQNGHSQYTSNLGFTDYGYGYKANQSSTLFGGFAPLSDNTELHAAIGFSKQTVKPQAVDGSSETRYKSTSFLVGLHNKWDNVILNTTFGYHSHRGKVSTSEQKNIGRIDGSQMQFAGEVGYEIPVGQFAVTPMLGLSYQQLKTDVEDTQDRWNIALKPYNVFSQQLGANISWRNDVVRLSAGTFYENSNGQPKAVSIAANGQYAEFATGRHGNALLFKVNSDFTLAKHLTFGLRIEHRHALSTAKLKQTQFGGKLEYRF
ncbi:exo-alpha-sialidase [Frederiksenia canicola]